MSKKGSLYDGLPKRPGHRIVGGVWKWDGQRYRVQQILYEPTKAAEPVEPRSGRQGLLI